MVSEPVNAALPVTGGAGSDPRAQWTPAALLAAYSEVRRLAADPPASMTLPPTDRPFHRAARRLHLLLRPTWAVERWTSRRIRRNVEALERGAAERRALDAHGDGHDLESLTRYRASLPTPLPRVLTVATLVVTILLTRALTTGGFRYFYLDEQTSNADVLRALDRIGSATDLAGLNELLRAVAGAHLEVLVIFVVSSALAVYLVLRASASGFRLMLLLFGQPDGLGVPRRRSHLHRRTEAARVRELEDGAFSTLDVRRPRELPFDLAVKALLAGAILTFAAYVLRTDSVGEEERWRVQAIAAAAALRLVWLGCASLKRRTGVLWLVLPLVIVIGGTLTARSVDDAEADRGVELPPDRELATRLSLQRDLRGADLRGRDLTHAYLRDKDLRLAELTEALLDEAVLARARLDGARLYDASLFNADLRGATLQRADLEGADLGAADLTNADLRRADLEGADLGGADLTNADLRRADLGGADLAETMLCGADLRGADLSGVSGASVTDSRTRWPDGRARTPRASAFDRCPTR